MPRIYLKPNSPEYAENSKATPSTHRCEMPGCALHGDHRAPKNRQLNDYYWFCTEHAREYNQAWNFFSGMSDTDIQNHIVESMYGHRPTWRYDLNRAEDALRRKAWQTYNYTEEEPPAAKPRNGHTIKANTPEGEALSIMNLEVPVTLEDIKTRYKALVKKHHPDVNPGCAKSEELLKSINMAYTILKVAYEQFTTLPERS